MELVTLESGEEEQVSELTFKTGAGMVTIGSTEFTRRSLLVLLGLTGIGGFNFSATARALEKTTVDVFRDPSCGCCGRWVEHLRQNGFAVNVAEAADMQSIKRAFGVPAELASCHTAKVGGYVIEGHVPASAIKRLLVERPQARGLTVPGMPAGSPGMEGAAPVAYDVILFESGTSEVYGRYKGAEEL